MKIPHFNQSFKDPWKRNYVWNVYDRFEGGIQDQDDVSEGRLAAARKQANGESAYKGVDHTKNPEDQKFKKDLKKALREFSEASNIDESKYEEMVDDCTTHEQLLNLEAKFKRGAVGYFKRLASEKKLFAPIDSSSAEVEEASLKAERDETIAWFEGLDLYPKQGSAKKGDMLHALNHFDADYKEKIEFKTELRRRFQKSSFLRSEYFRLLGDPRVNLEFSKKGLLQKILKPVKAVEDAPGAIQYEFSKKAEEAGANLEKDTENIRIEVQKKFDEKVKIYNEKILSSKDNFGGEWMVTPYGKMRAAAWEYISQFQKRQNFAEMDDWTAKLPSILTDREKIYKERNDLLADLPEADAKKLTDYTARMRFHTLKAYMKDLRKEVSNKGTSVLEYSAILQLTTVRGMDAFTEKEKSEMKRKFKVADPELQDALLKVLQKQEIPDRTKLINEYSELPTHVRNDKKFITGNIYDRREILDDALEQLNREKKNPLDVSGALSNARIEDKKQILKDRMESEQGKNGLKDRINEMQQKGQLDVVEGQGLLHRRLTTVGLDMKKRNLSMKDEYLEDLAYWMHANKGLAHSRDNVRSERDEWKRDALENAANNYDYGKVQNSGGNLGNLVTLTREQIGKGLDDEKLAEVKHAKYAQHIMIKDDTGRDSLDPLRDIKREVIPQMRLLIKMLKEYFAGDLNMDASDEQNFMNSSSIDETMAEALLQQEVGQYFEGDPANNTDSFIQQVIA